MLKEDIFKVINNTNTMKMDVIKSLLLPNLGFIINDFNPANSSLSKVGGHPPINEEDWPIFMTKPLLFLVQISLSEIGYINNLLPKEGFLSFFLLTENIHNRYPDRKDEFKVIYKKDIDQKKHNRDSITLNEHSISFLEFYTFPSYQESVLIKSNLTEEELFFIEEIESDMLPFEFDGCDIGHQILGHPKAIQGTVRFWWAIKYLGFENMDTLSELQKEMVEQEEGKFVLLLQLDFSDPKITVDYFGESVAYFGIHQQDLENRNFDNVILVMQNT